MNYATLVRDSPPDVIRGITVAYIDVVVQLVFTDNCASYAKKCRPPGHWNYKSQTFFGIIFSGDGLLGVWFINHEIHAYSENPMRFSRFSVEWAFKRGRLHLLWQKRIAQELTLACIPQPGVVSAGRMYVIWMDCTALGAKLGRIQGGGSVPRAF